MEPEKVCLLDFKPERCMFPTALKKYGKDKERMAKFCFNLRCPVATLIQKSGSKIAMMRCDFVGSIYDPQAPEEGKWRRIK